MDNTIWYFGKNKDFTAFYKEGWLAIICGGGTGYAEKASSIEQAKVMLKPFKGATEEQVIKNCIVWEIFNYYTYKIYARMNIIRKLHTFSQDTINELKEYWDKNKENTNEAI